MSFISPTRPLPIPGTLAAFVLAAIPGFSAAEEWTALLDRDLSRWEVFMGVPHPSVEIPGHPKSTGPKPEDGTEIGLGNDPLGVFTMTEEDGEPVLHVSGQIYGGLSTKEEFANYHLVWQFKWGGKQWPPRLNTKRDSGMLVHCQPPHGAFWKVWMRSLECQIQEGDCGDFIPLAGSGANVRIRTEADNPRPVFDPEGVLSKNTGYTRHSPSPEKPNGEWNTMEIYAVGDTVVHVVNGTPNMVLFDTSQAAPDGKGRTPLTKGRLQIQSEAAEIFYKDIRICAIDRFPDELKKITTRPEGDPLRFQPPQAR